MASGKDIVRHGSGSQRVAAVTTSWDDGHPLDLRLAELLGSHGLRGTFYVPGRYDGGPVMEADEIRALHRMGMEIGSHTMNHLVLTKLREDQVLQELSDSKKWLEDLLGEPVVSFCYPKGKFNRMVRAQVVKAGYLLARTTVAFRIECPSNPWLMPTSFQFYPHRRAIHIRHAVREGNLKGLKDWKRLWGMETNLIRLAERMSENVAAAGGVLHIWGHSWELEKFNLWDRLDEVLIRITEAQRLVAFTNAQVLKAEQ